jgi:hypothetical protein
VLTKKLATTLVACLLCAPASAEYFVDLGVSTIRVESKIGTRQSTINRTDSGIHVGVGARRMINERSDIGVRIELDRVDSDLLLAVRALDYRRHISERLAYSVFGGAARLDLATPAYGWYFGGGITLKNLADTWDLNVDLRIGDKVARDNLLPTDPQGIASDNFHDVTGISVYLSRRF